MMAFEAEAFSRVSAIRPIRYGLSLTIFMHKCVGAAIVSKVANGCGSKRASTRLRKYARSQAQEVLTRFHTILHVIHATTNRLPRFFFCVPICDIVLAAIFRALNLTGGAYFLGRVDSCQNVVL